MKRRPPRRESMDPDVREGVLRRDGYRCRLPGKYPEHVCAGRLHVHHRLPRGQGGTDDPDNLVTLCLSGHGFVHEHPELSYEWGLLVRVGPPRG